jgi:hypothetical protein
VTSRPPGWASNFDPNFDAGSTVPRLNLTTARRDYPSTQFEGPTMTLTRFQIAALKKLLHGDLPLAKFCDSHEGETLCWSGLVRIRRHADALRNMVTLSDHGRAALQGHLG